MIILFRFDYILFRRTLNYMNYTLSAILLTFQVLNKCGMIKKFVYALNTIEM